MTVLSAPTVTALADLDRNGSLSAQELLRAGGHLSWQVRLPSGAVAGDVLTLVSSSGQQTQIVLSSAQVRQGLVVWTDSLATTAGTAATTASLSASLVHDGSSTASGSASLGVAAAASSSLAAPVVRLSTDSDDDGHISSAELAATGGRLRASITLPTGAVAGDTLIVTDADGQERRWTLTRSDIARGSLSISTAVDETADEALSLSARLVQRATGAVTASGSDSASLALDAQAATLDSLQVTGTGTGTACGSRQRDASRTASVDEGDAAVFVLRAEAGTVDTVVTLSLGTQAADVSALQINQGEGWETVAADGRFTLQAGVSVVQVRVQTLDDSTVEGDETLTLSATVAATADTAASTVTASLTIVDDDPRTATTASATEDTPLVLGLAAFGLAAEAQDSATVSIDTLPRAGSLQLLVNGAWTTVSAGQEISAADIAAGSLRFVPAAEVSASGGDTRTGRASDGAATFDYSVSDGDAAVVSRALEIDIAPVADVDTLTATLLSTSTVVSLETGSAFGSWPTALIGAAASGETTLHQVRFGVAGSSSDSDGSELTRIALTGLVTADGVTERVFTADGTQILADADGVIWVEPGQTVWITGSGTTDQAYEATVWRVETDALGAVLDSAAGETVSLGWTTPLVLDLDGDGIETTTLADGVGFDLDADGQAETTAWVSGGDGLLAIDLDGNGRIDSGAELFGSATTLADGRTADDGYAALADLDSNGDGLISAADARWSELVIWVDADADGVSDDGELQGLDALGIASLDLAAVASGAEDQGNALGLVGQWTDADGETHAMADVWFQTAGTLADSGLADDAALDLLLSHQDSAVATTTTTATDGAAPAGCVAGADVATDSTAADAGTGRGSHAAGVGDGLSGGLAADWRTWLGHSGAEQLAAHAQQVHGG
ncbi:hypothetical protein [Pseudaquabacterium rugosum]|uniref:Calx-beta domain-containing protein n=1 Tax=Pseudaquabacterium rugosum TaxID=2984194 RepID=A0ABU9BCL7_9BURK